MLFGISAEAWAVIAGSVPGYAALLCAIYTFSTDRGKRWFRRVLGVENLAEQHEKQAENLGRVCTELRAVKAVSIASAKTINGLAEVVGEDVEDVDPDDLPEMRIGTAREALYSESEFDPNDFHIEGAD